jgi:hypothetical protein
LQYKKRSGEFEAKVGDRKKKLVVKRSVFLTSASSGLGRQAMNFMIGNSNVCSSIKLRLACQAAEADS